MCKSREQKLITKEHIAMHTNLILLFKPALYPSIVFKVHSIKLNSYCNTIHQSCLTRRAQACAWFLKLIWCGCSVPYAYFIPYAYGMYHTRMVQFCIPYTYSMTIHVWYVPYAYNYVLRADSMSRLLECI